MNLNTRIMLEAIALYGSENSQFTAQKILTGSTTVAEESKYSGSFMQAVYRGDFLDAYGLADSQNKNALKSILK